MWVTKQHRNQELVRSTNKGIHNRQKDYEIEQVFQWSSPRKAEKANAPWNGILGNGKQHLGASAGDTGWLEARESGEHWISGLETYSWRPARWSSKESLQTLLHANIRKNGYTHHALGVSMLGSSNPSVSGHRMPALWNTTKPWVSEAWSSILKHIFKMARVWGDALFMSHPLPQSVISLVKALIMINFLGFVTINVVVAFYMIITLIKKKTCKYLHSFY